MKRHCDADSKNGSETNPFVCSSAAFKRTSGSAPETAPKFQGRQRWLCRNGDENKPTAISVRHLSSSALGRRSVPCPKHDLGIIMKTPGIRGFLNAARLVCFGRANAELIDREVAQTTSAGDVPSASCVLRVLSAINAKVQLISGVSICLKSYACANNALVPGWNF